MKHLSVRAVRTAALLAFISLGGLAGAQQVEVLAVDAPGTTPRFKNFGVTTAIDGDWAVVGDTQGAGPTNSTGTCVVYRRTEQGWIQWQILAPTLADPILRFGHSIALHGDELAIGALRGGLDHTGRVHIFHLENGYWVEVQQLRATQASGGNDAFGSGLAFDEQTLVVGSLGYPDSTFGTGGFGACYVYERGPGQWILSERIALPDFTQTAHDYWGGFGWSCAVEGDLMVIGAPGVGGQGMAFAYRRGPAGWQLEAELYLPQYAPHFVFALGSSVAVSGGTIALGAPMAYNAFYSGFSSVWIFEYDPTLQAWAQVQMLRASDVGLATDLDFFGRTLSLGGDRLVVGATGGGYNGPLSGTAYLFERDNGTWSEVQRFVASEVNPGSPPLAAIFGEGIALDAKNGRVLVGAAEGWNYSYPPISARAGKAYFFDLNQGTVMCEGFPNETLAAALLTATGSREVSSANLSLSVYDAPPGVMGMFLVGPGGPPVPFGVGGSLCVGQPFSRLTGIRTVGPGGSAMHQVDFAVEPASNLISPGAALMFQFAYRDTFFITGQATFNASDAIRVVFE